MADMISAAEAKQMLGCDDATLQSFIDNGTIRTQESGGGVLLNREDVQAINESDDGTIILSGDSEDLSIDLGDVLEEGGGPASADLQLDSESNDMDVVDFDSGNTVDMNMTAGTEDLSFTDSNTAAATSVDETMVDQTSDLQTVDFGETMEEDAYEDEPATGRRTRGSRRSASMTSVQSQRGEIAVERPVHPAFPIIMGLCALVLALLVLPYMLMHTWPNRDVPVLERTGETPRGFRDNFWTDMAAGAPWVDYSVEPNPEAHAQVSDKPHKPMPNAPDYRHQLYVGSLGSVDKAIEASIIDEINTDPESGNIKTASALGDDGNVLRTYDFNTQTTQLQTGETVQTTEPDQ